MEYKFPISFLEGALVQKCSIFLFLLKQCQEQKYRCLPATLIGLIVILPFTDIVSAPGWLDIRRNQLCAEVPSVQGLF